MTVTTVKDRLAEILENETSALTAYARSPQGIVSADLPMFIITTQSGVLNTGANLGSAYDLPVESRQYNLVLLALPWSMGTDLEAETACEPFFAEVANALTRRESLEYPRKQNALAGVLQAKLISDTGIVNVVYNDSRFAGVIWTVEVIEILVPGSFEEE
jgi:hypothetical protein